MATWSTDDRFLLTSAVDNEVRQWSASSGRCVKHFSIRKTGNWQNYTRSYYNCDGRYIFSGSAKEGILRVICASTGQLLREVELAPPLFSDLDAYDLSVLSLRGHVSEPFKCAVMASYHLPHVRDEHRCADLLSVDFTGS